jgi:PleD family two-component response regulator
MQPAPVAEALDRAAVRPPDAAIVELVLPDGDGVDLCRRLRAWSAAPLIFLTTVDTEHDRVRALDGGADDYLPSRLHPGSSSPGCGRTCGERSAPRTSRESNWKAWRSLSPRTPYAATAHPST